MLPRKELHPVTVYYILSAGYTLFLQIVVSVNIVFQTQEAGLDPLQLVLVGTAMEATIFVCEVPTGMVADIYGRRASVLFGLAVMGSGIILTGAFPIFETILFGSVIWGFGFTFISGARQAWIADEIGVDAAGPVYLRATQVSQAVRLAAIPASIGVATLDLNLPILIGGLLFILLGIFLAFTMPETGHQGGRERYGLNATAFVGTFKEGRALVAGSPLLITVFLIMAFYGAASEGFDRLWVAHFDRTLGLPTVGDLDPVVWFGVLRMGAAVFSLVAVEVVRQRVDTTRHDTVSHGLFLINGLQVASLVGFAFAPDFEVAMLLFWAAVALSSMYEPLRLAWLNQSIEPQVRATVLSMSSQMDAIGQMTGGPLLGLAGKLEGLRAALLGSALCLTPALLLYVRAFGQGRRAPLVAEEVESGSQH